MPSPSRSTSITSGWPACSRVTIVSSPLPPSTVSSPCCNVGALSFGARLGGGHSTARDGGRSGEGQDRGPDRTVGARLENEPLHGVPFFLGVVDLPLAPRTPAARIHSRQTQREYLRSRGVFQSMAPSLRRSPAVRRYLSGCCGVEAPSRRRGRRSGARRARGARRRLAPCGAPNGARGAGRGVP